MNEKPVVGISTCLLGEKVRYDGAGKLNHYIRDVLGQYVEFVSICPEVESGMGVPREAMRLVEVKGDIRLLTRTTQRDMTGQLNTWMNKKISRISSVPLCGYIFKSGSPSCGLMRVKLYKQQGGVTRKQTGLFAKSLTELFPVLPVEEEGRLNDSRLRENFIERVFIMQRWHKLNKGRKTINKLMEFHARHKYTLMAHCPATLRNLGAFIANSHSDPLTGVYEHYFREFIMALEKHATPRKNTNVLQHIMGYFRKVLSKDEKEELGEIIESYHSGLIPLIVPVTLLNHYVRKYKEPYLNKQYYLNPHPMELMLRNHT